MEEDPELPEGAERCSPDPAWRQVVESYQIAKLIAGSGIVILVLIVVLKGLKLI